MTRLHHDYIHQVLYDRGVRSPDIAALRAYSESVELMPEQEASMAVAALKRLSMGAEGSGELEALLLDIAAANSGATSALRAVSAQALVLGTQCAAEPISRQDARFIARAPRVAQAELRTVKRTFDCEDERPTEADLALLRQHGMHVYGKSAALKIELSQLRAGDGDSAPHYTLQLEGATSDAGRYDWRRKIAFQFTRRELPLLAAFLLGHAGTSLSFDNHGPGNDKHLTINDQGKHCFVRLRATGHTMVTVPVSPPDVFAWGELALVALQLNRPLLAAESQIALLRRLGAMVRASEARA